MSGSSAFIRSFGCFQYSATSSQHPRGAPLAQGTHVTPSPLESNIDSDMMAKGVNLQINGNWSIITYVCNFIGARWNLR